MQVHDREAGVRMGALRDAPAPRRPSFSPREKVDRTWLLLGGSLYSIFLALTITTRSLSTDEAFSAYISGHRSFAQLWSTLKLGDSSDLQMYLHYLYLHAWTLLFGSTELALRASNLPFIFVFGFSMVWGSLRIFGARWQWIGPALLPLIWLYGSEARPYMALLAFSTLSTVCFLAYLQEPSARERTVLPVLVLAGLLVGAGFHMLTLLLVFPLAVVGFVLVRSQPGRFKMADWWRPAFVFALPFAAYLVFLAWTFLRGTAYAYQRPSLLSMGSLVYRFLGLFGYGPNRHYEIPFRPYLPAIAAATLLLLVALGLTVRLGWRSAERTWIRSLLWGCAAAGLEVLVLSRVAGEQIELRHLAGVAPLFLFWIVACLSQVQGERERRLAITATFLLLLVWGVANYRLLCLPENQWENFRAAVGRALTLADNDRGAIALVADPAAGSYYGLDVQGPKPCFPLADACGAGFQKVDWPRRHEASYSVNWSYAQVTSWLAQQRSKHKAAVVIISTSRHPMYKDSPWWPILSSLKSAEYQVHGFCIFVVQPS